VETSVYTRHSFENHQLGIQLANFLHQFLCIGIRIPPNAAAVELLWAEISSYVFLAEERIASFVAARCGGNDVGCDLANGQSDGDCSALCDAQHSWTVILQKTAEDGSTLPIQLEIKMVGGSTLPQRCLYQGNGGCAEEAEFWFA